MSRLDRNTADRLLNGTIPPDDAPPAYRSVAEVISALGEPTSSDPTDDARAVADLSAVVTASLMSATPSGHTQDRSTRPRRRAPILLAAAVAGLVAVGGLAAAGALPGVSSGSPPAETPEPNTNAGDHPDVRGLSGDHVPTSTPEAAPPSTPPGDTKGAEISATAQGPETGIDKGAVVSDAASGGASQVPTSLPTSPTLPSESQTPPPADQGLGHLPG